MTLEGHKKAVCRRWIELINEQHVDRIVDFHDEAFAENYIGHPGKWSRDETKQHWVTYLKPQPVFTVTIDTMIAEGDTVAMRLIWHEGDQAPHFALVFARLVERKVVETWYLTEGSYPSKNP